MPDESPLDALKRVGATPAGDEAPAKPIDGVDPVEALRTAVHGPKPFGGAHDIYRPEAFAQQERDKIPAVSDDEADELAGLMGVGADSATPDALREQVAGEMGVESIGGTGKAFNPVLDKIDAEAERRHRLALFREKFPWVKNEADAGAFREAVDVMHATQWAARAIDAGDITGEHGGKFTAAKWQAARMSKEKMALALEYQSSLGDPAAARKLLGRLKSIDEDEYQSSRSTYAGLNHVSDFASSLSMGFLDTTADIDDRDLMGMQRERGERGIGGKFVGATATLIPAMVHVGKMQGVATRTAHKMGMSAGRAQLWGRSTAMGAFTASQGGDFETGATLGFISPVMGAKLAKATRGLGAGAQKAVWEAASTVAIGGAMHGFDGDEMIIDAIIGIATSGLQSRRSFMREVHDVQRAFRVGGPNSPKARDAIVSVMKRMRSRVKGGDGGEAISARGDAVTRFDDTIKKVEALPVGGAPEDATPAARKGAVEPQPEAEAGGPALEVPPNRRIRADIGEWVELKPRTAEDLVLGDPERKTSIANRITNSERESRGLGPVAQDARRKFGAAWDRGMESMGFNPGSDEAMGKVRSILDNPRAIDDWEQAGILAVKIAQTNQRAKLLKDLDAAEGPEIREIQGQLAGVEANLNTIDEAAKIAGTETARSLSIRQMMAALDFTEAGVIDKVRSAQGGKALDEVQSAKVKEITKKYEAANQELSDLRKRLDEYQSIERVRDEIAAGSGGADFGKAYKTPAWGAGNKLVTQKRVDEIDKLLSGKFRGAQSNPFTDPEAIRLMAEKLAFHMEAGARRVGDYTKVAVDLFGENVKPYVADLYRASQRHLTKGADKRAVRSLDEQIKAGIASGDRATLHPVAKKMARDLVKGGESDPQRVVDAVHERLVKHDPNITRRESQDAITGYGIFREARKSTADAKVREITGVLRELSKLEDLRAGKVPKASGSEHVAPGVAERLLKREVTQLKKDSGKRSPGKGFVKMPLDTYQRSVKNRIGELNEQIARGRRLRKSESRMTLDKETRDLVRVRDGLQKTLDAIDPVKRPKLTDEQRIAIAEKSVAKAIRGLKKRIAAGDTSTRSKGGPTSPKLEAMRAELTALNAQMRSMRPAKKVTVEMAQRSLEARLTNQLAEIRRRIVEADYFPKKPEPPELSKRSLELEAEIAAGRKQLNDLIIQAKISQEGKVGKIGRVIKELVATTRALKASGDISFFGRQGWFLLASNPRLIPEFFRSTFRGARNEQALQIEDARVRKHEDYREAVRNGLDFTANDPSDLKTAEEVFMSRYAESIPGLGRLVGWSNRAYVAGGNSLRMNAYSLLKNNLFGTTPPTDVELRTLANFINNATGRGTIMGFEQSMGDLARVAFAPRLAASRFSMALGLPMITGGKGVGATKMTARTRVLVAKQYVKFAIAQYALAQLVQGAGGEVEDDTRSSDFGKWRFGEARIDPWAGISQAAVLTSRIAQGETKSATSGNVKVNRGPDKDFTTSSPVELIGRFLRNKAAPVPAEALEFIDQKDFEGEAPTVGGTLADLTLPFSIGDIYEAFREEDVDAATAQSILALLGFGLNRFGAPDSDD